MSIQPISHTEVGISIGCYVSGADWVLDQSIGGSEEPHAVDPPFVWTIRANTEGLSPTISRVNFTIDDVSIVGRSGMMPAGKLVWPVVRGSNALLVDVREPAIANMPLVESRYVSIAEQEIGELSRNDEFFMKTGATATLSDAHAQFQMKLSVSPVIRVEVPDFIEKSKLFINGDTPVPPMGIPGECIISSRGELHERVSPKDSNQSFVYVLFDIGGVTSPIER